MNEKFPKDAEKEPKKLDIDELEKDDLEDASGGLSSTNPTPGDKNCGCGPSGD